MTLVAQLVYCTRMDASHGWRARYVYEREHVVNHIALRAWSKRCQ